MSEFYQSSFQQQQNITGFPNLPSQVAFNDRTTGCSADEPSPWTDVPQKTLEEPKAVSKRRQPSGNDQVKHRRTRNGCYTCRNRRVKCDEQRPTCERCAKGSRECTYPEPRSNTRPPGVSKQDQTRTAACNDEYWSEDGEGVEVYSSSKTLGKTRPNLGYHNSNSANSQRRSSSSKILDTIPFTQREASREHLRSENSRSSSTDNSSAPASAGLERSQKTSSVSTNVFQEDKSWSHLPQDLQYHLEYHLMHLNYHHYFFKHDANQFLHNALLEQALLYEPLLYAVVGFAAFQMTVKNPGGRIQDFLIYYNKSVSLLRKSLAGGQTHTDATMLTILQLATFEEYLGDYVSLLGHQQAACRMLLELYSPRTIMETEIRRKIFAWYARFDLTGGLMSGNETALSREWFLAIERYHRAQSLNDPMSIDYKIEAAVAKHRLLCTDMALLFADFSRGAVTIEHFATESNEYAEQMRNWHDNLDPVFRSEQYQVKSFEGRTKDLDDIVDPYRPGGIYRDPLFSFNFMLLDWHGLSLMFKYKTAMLLQQPPPAELESLALELCRLFETIEYWPESPPGSVLKSQACLGLASMFLPKDDKHIMWCRKKLAMVESLGHIYPPTFRQRMAELWGVPGINHWWLPDDESYPAIVRSVRSFMENRLPLAARQSRSEDQRNIKGIFAQLTVHEGANYIGEDDATAIQRSSSDRAGRKS